MEQVKTTETVEGKKKRGQEMNVVTHKISGKLREIMAKNTRQKIQNL